MTSEILSNRYEKFRDWLRAYSHFGIYHALSRLPVDVASDVGSFLVRRNVAQNLPHVLSGAKHNLSRLHPEWTDAEVHAGCARFVDNVGRLYGEFAVLHRLVDERRVDFNRNQIISILSSQRPTIIVMLHTGNWEVFGAALAHMDLSVSSFYKPPDIAMHAELVQLTRTRLGIDLLPPNAKGVRKAKGLLARGKAFVMFGDEARDGQTMAPLFGRPPHTRGNLALISRLAISAKAQIVIGHCVRIKRCHFSLNLSDPIDIGNEIDTDGSVLDAVYFLSNLIEPIIHRNSDQWYFLDDKF